MPGLSDYLQGFKEYLKNMDKKILDYLYPNDEYCLFCNRRFPSERYFLCQKCESGLKELSSDQKILGFPLAKSHTMRHLSAMELTPFEFLCVKYSNSRFAKRLLLSYKKYHKAYLSFCLSKMLIELIDEMVDMADMDALTYIPSTKAKIRKKGFDNMRLIAEKVAEHYEMDLVDVLGIKSVNEEQKSLSRDRRYKNISEAFYTKYRLIKNQNTPIKILLLDDVITTGATMESAARCLKKEGYLVYGAVIFRATHD